MSEQINHRAAATIVEDALCAVFDEDLVRRLRADSPLEAVGLTDADLVCVTDAIEMAASAVGLHCALRDEDLVGVDTIDDLIRSVCERAASERESGSTP